MEFQKDPLQVTETYRANIAKTLEVSRVAASGWFYQTGVFDIVKRREVISRIGDATRMWALNLLRYSEAEDGVRTGKHGFLYVYHGRMTRNREVPVVPIHTIDPANVRFVDDWNSFEAKVGKSEWIFNERAAWRQRESDDQLTNERLEKILAEAEVGKKPPFFDDDTQYIKVEPGLVGRKVSVIKFSSGDLVVVDVEARKLVGKKVEPLLSKQRWEGTAAQVNNLSNLEENPL